MLLTDKYTDKIYGAITYYDGIIIQEYITWMNPCSTHDKISECQQYPYF